MYVLNRMAELNVLGANVSHILEKIEKKDAFLVSLYKGILEIIVDVLNDTSDEPLQDTLDRMLGGTEMDKDSRLSIFDYTLNLIEKAAIHFQLMGVIEEVKYKLEIKNEKLLVGRDKILIDFYATYYAMDEKLKPVVTQDAIDNPSLEDMDKIFNVNE